VLLISSCETDLKEVNRIASIKEEEPIDISRGVTVIFSDSARVKAKMTAPEMRQFSGMQGDSVIGESYHEFQKGVKIIFFDEQGDELQNIVSDYAIRRMDQKLVEFKGNVIITRSDGSVIKTEELIHNEEANTFYNHVPIFGFSKDGFSTFQGTSFKSDGDFQNIIIQQSTGITYMQDNN
jgi:LPS export ABC transporter protein LptC